MDRYIRFRSHKIDTSSLGIHMPNRRWRGSDFCDITPYTTGDDTRDISWRHSARSTTLQKKIRLDDGSFPIVVINTIGSDSGFYTEADTTSPYQYAWEIEDTLKNSAHKYHFPMRESCDIRALEWSRNNMIIYITSSLDGSSLDTLRVISEGNDIIVIHVFHPYEIAPTPWLIFDGLGLDTKRYIREFSDKKTQFQKRTYSIQWSYLCLLTSDNIVTRVNQFFKNRFSS